MALESCTVDSLDLKKEIKEEVILSNQDLDSELKSIENVNPEGVRSDDSDESVDGSDEEKPDLNSLLCGDNFQLKVESDCEEDDEPLPPAPIIKTEPISPNKEVSEITRCEVRTNSSDENSVSFKEELEDDDNNSLSNSNDASDSVDINVGDKVSSQHDLVLNKLVVVCSKLSPELLNELCDSPKNNRKFSTSNSKSIVTDVVKIPDSPERKRKRINEYYNSINTDNEKTSHDSPKKKRKVSQDHSNGVSSDCNVNSNINTHRGKRKRVHFAKDGTLKSTRIFECSKKPVTFTPSSKEPGTGILKNKLATCETKKKKEKLVRNHKEGKKTKPTLSEANVPNNIEKPLRKPLINKDKVSSAVKGKKNKASVKNAKTVANSQITDFFNKKNEDTGEKEKLVSIALKTEPDDSNESEQKKNLKTSDNGNEKTNIETGSSIDSQKENLTVKTETRRIKHKIKAKKRNFFSHCQKKKSKTQYAYNHPVLAFLCICGSWCKSGPDLVDHLSVCPRLQPRVVLKKL